MHQLTQALQTGNDPAIYLVVLLGLGVVFAGLLINILLCKVIALAAPKQKKVPAQEAISPEAPEAPQLVRLPDETIAAIGAAIAEDAGVDVSAIRIVSVNKI